MTSARECKTQNHADLVRGEKTKNEKKENKRKKKLNLLGDETAKRITGRDVIVTEVVVVVVQMQFRIVIGFTLQTGVRWHTGKRTEFTNTHDKHSGIFFQIKKKKKKKRKTEKKQMRSKKTKNEKRNKLFFVYEVGPAAVAVIRMPPWVSLAVAEAPTEALPRVAAIVEADAPLAEEEHVELFLMLNAVKLDPSLTARIDGVEMDFCSVNIRGESHLVGSPPTPLPSLDNPRGFVGNAGINWNPIE